MVLYHYLRIKLRISEKVYYKILICNKLMKCVLKKLSLFL